MSISYYDAGKGAGWLTQRDTYAQSRGWNRTSQDSASVLKPVLRQIIFEILEETKSNNKEAFIEVKVLAKATGISESFLSQPSKLVPIESP